MDSQTKHHQIHNLGRNTTNPALQRNHEKHGLDTNDQSSVRNQCRDSSASSIEDNTIVNLDNDDKPGAWSHVNCRGA